MGCKKSEDVRQRGQSSSYKMNKFRGYNVEHHKGVLGHFSRV